jgi:hypothetical protein
MAQMKEAGVTPLFKNIAIKNEAKSKLAGRPIFDDMEVVEVRFAGTKDYSVFPSMEYSHWIDDEETGERRRITYAERWPRQYRQFKEKQQQTKSGTPLDYLPFLTEAKRAELRALSIYTAEALAELDGLPLKNLGTGGRDLKNLATDYLASSDHNAVISRLQQEIEALKTKLSVREEERQYLTNPPKPEEQAPVPPDDDTEGEDSDEDGEGVDERKVAASANTSEEFVGMNSAQLRAYITENTGKRPVGNPSMKTLLRMAEDARV